MNYLIKKIIAWFRLIIHKPKLIKYKGKRLFLASGMYFNGKKQGFFRVYNKKGDLVKIEQYKKGNLVSFYSTT